MRKVIAVMIIFFCVCIVFAGKENTYKYEPEEVELYGVLTQKMFYGPPGYGENPEVDMKENIYILQLNEAITVEAEEGDKFNQTRSGVKEIQILNNTNSELTGFLNKKVKVKGMLFSAHTGHHFREIIIDLRAIEIAE